MMKFLRKGSILFSLLFAQLCYGQSTANKLPSWAFGGFARPANINPIISPDTSSKFLDPMSNRRVGWEAFYTFNPAATIKNGKVVVLYRSEDMTGDSIGTRTSRIGYAESSDGLTFTWSGKPVVYPGDDNQKEFEWPGGCEDPRVAVTIVKPTPGQQAPYLAISGTARITEGGAPELLKKLATVMLGSEEHFPPPNSPPGLLTRIRIDKVGGSGPWTA